MFWPWSLCATVCRFSTRAPIELGKIAFEPPDSGESFYVLFEVFVMKDVLAKKRILNEWDGGSKALRMKTEA